MQPNISKIYIKILADRLQQYIVENNIINEFQARIREGYETIDNVLIIKSTIDRALTKKGIKFIFAL